MFYFENILSLLKEVPMSQHFYFYVEFLYHFNLDFHP